MRLRIRSILLLVLLAAVRANDAIAGVPIFTGLKVDFGVADIGDVTSITPNDVQSGFSGFSVNPQFAGVPSQYDLVNIGVGSETRTFAGSVDVTISGTGNGATFFDFATDVTHALGDLLEDGVGVIEADLILTLKGLPAGAYQTTTYHHNAGVANAGLPFSILVNNSSGETTAATNVPVTLGFTPASVSSATFQFTATGLNNVVIRFHGGGDFQNPINPFLNGFTLVPVPEPSSWLLLVLGMSALGWVRVVRRVRGAAQ